LKDGFVPQRKAKALHSSDQSPLPMPDGNAAERAVDDPAERAWRAAFIDYQARRGGIGGANATVNRLIATYPSFADVGPRLREDLARARAYVRAAQRMTADARRD